MASKLMTLPEAAGLVKDGAHIALGGFAITRCVVAGAHELIRAGRRGLTLTQVIGGMDTDLLVGAGCVDHLIYAGGSLDRFGPLYSVTEAIGKGSLRTEEYSSLALTLRLHAAALNVPYLPCRSMLGSDLLEPLQATGSVKVAQDPFSGRPVVLVSALRPDVAFLHVDAADSRGNATVKGPTWTMRDTAFASTSVVLLCEEVVPDGVIPPDDVFIPGAIVTAVVEARGAARPTAVMGCYDYDRGRLEEYAQMARLGRDGFKTYLDRYVFESVSDA